MPPELSALAENDGIPPGAGGKRRRAITTATMMITTERIRARKIRDTADSLSIVSPVNAQPCISLPVPGGIPVDGEVFFPFISIYLRFFSSLRIRVRGDSR